MRCLKRFDVSTLKRAGGLLSPPYPGAKSAGLVTLRESRVNAANQAINCPSSIRSASIQFHDHGAGKKRIIEFGAFSGLLSGNEKETGGKGLVQFG